MLRFRLVPVGILSGITIASAASAQPATVLPSELGAGDLASVAVAKSGAEPIVAGEPTVAQPVPLGAPAASGTGTLGSVATAAPGSDRPGQSDTASPKKGEDIRNLPGQQAVFGGLNVSFDTSLSVGQSTFQLGPGYADDPQVGWSSSLGAGYQFEDRTRVSTSIGLSQELTPPDGDDDQYTMILGDLAVSASRPLHRFSFGTTLLGGVSFRLPTSDASRIQTLRTSSTARLSGVHRLGKLTASLGSSFTKNFHKYDNPVIDPRGQGVIATRDRLVVSDTRLGLARAGGQELISDTQLALAGQNNRSFAWSNNLSLNYPLTDKLALTVSYGLSHSWGYRSYELDELSGVGAKAGRGRSDSHSGTIAAGYPVWDDHVLLSMGMSTGGPTRTADDRGIRFPFFTFPGQGVENNFTTFFFGFTVTEHVSL